MNAKALTNQRFIFLANTLFLIIILLASKAYAVDHNVSVTLMSGATGQPIISHSAGLYELLDNGSEHKIQSVKSDNQGLIQLNIPNLNTGQQYLLKTSNPYDGRTWKSQLISTGSSVFTVGNKLLNVAVSSGIDNQPLTNQAVIVYKILSNGSRKGFRTVTTDTNGRLSLDLPGLGSDTPYQLRTLPKYGNRVIYSETINATGSFTFKVANVRIKAINGRTNGLIENHKIHAYKYNSDGSTTWVSSIYTDTSGFVDFQLPNLANQSYIFKAGSLSDGKIWTSEPVSSSGTSSFVIGNKLLNVTVSSGIDNQPLTNQAVIIYKMLSNGSRKGFRTVTTDTNGLLSLDLPGLGSDTSYQLRTLPKHGNRVIYSETISATGSFAFKVANARVKAVDGKTNNFIANHKVTAYKVQANGSAAYQASAITDATGFADFQLPNLTNQPYIFKAASLSDNRTWTSEPITASGTSAFIIGNKLLNVTVSSGIDNQPLTNQAVIVYKILSNGSRKGFRTVTTDTIGHLSLDLPGLGSDTPYQLRTLPKHGNRVIYSETINATGSFAFKVANARVKAVDGKTNNFIANHKVTAYKVQANGSVAYQTSAITDATGFADFQLPNLTNQPYIFKATSLSDNRTWTSEPITSSSTSTFVIGNKLLNVAVSSGIDNQPLANQAVTIYQLLTDGSRKGIRSVTTDTNGLLSLDLPGLGIDTVYELRTLPKHGSRMIFSGGISTTGNFAFKVANVRIKAINGRTNGLIKNHKILAYKYNSDGSTTWVSSIYTDTSGFADFQLPNLTSQSYIFKSASLSNGKIWTSESVSTPGTSSFVIGNKLLNVTVSSGIDNQPLTNQAVIVYKILSNGSRKGFRTVTTDTNGHLSLDLPGLGSDTPYQLRTLPKHGNRVIYSETINATGSFAFKVANARVKAVDGKTNNFIANHKVTAYKIQANGSAAYQTSAITDATGFADFQLPNLTNQPYIFKAASLSDNRTWTSEPITASGTSAFIIGNKLLNITVSSGIDNQPLTNQAVIVYKILSNGSRKGFRTVTTDTNGLLSLDLPGLGSNTTYQLRTLPKHGNRAIYSETINATGSFAFKVANVRVKAVDGRTNNIIGSHKITVYKRKADNSESWFTYANTTASGYADFFLPNLSFGEKYIFKAKSLSDGKTWKSDLVTSMGSSTFIIGNKLLNVAVSSGVDKQPLAKQDVTVYQLLADGSRKWFRSVTTDTNGHLSLDLPGLGSDTPYQLRTLPKHGDRVIYSAAINSTGGFTFKVANARVKAIDGKTNKFIAKHKVTAYKVQANGSVAYQTSAITDAAGFADFQLPNLANQPYIFKAASLSDGRTWTSKPISTSGSSTFVIGNKLLNVTVSSGIDNHPLANQPVIIYQLLADDSRKGIRTVTTDNNGLLTLDLPGLGTNTDYELRTLPQHGNRVVYSGRINTTGNFSFKVANVRVKAINGRTNNIINAHKIGVFKHHTDGTETWFLSANTDSLGYVDFQLPNLESGQQYLYKAKSLSDGRNWKSELIKTAGTSTFRIGNKLLNVSLANALDNKPLANIEVTAYTQMPDNSLKWSQKQTTNSTGQVNFDLKGLGNGTNYILSSRPYGVKILSEQVTKTGLLKIKAGAVAVTLRKKDNNAVIQNHKLTLYEKTAPGKIKWLASSTTDQSGKVHFDPSGLGTGKVYLVIANNLFGQGKNYYSQWITTKGYVDFIVSADDPHKLDEEPPTFNHIYPANHAVLADKGFKLSMKISDNNTVKTVNMRIIDPIKGTTTSHATLLGNEWSYAVNASMITKDQTITVEIDALDQVGNISSVSYQYAIINDIEKPALTISSHQSGDQIDEHGFFITGSVTDNTGYVKLLATVIDPIKGTIIDHKDLEIGKNNHWALIAKDLSRGQDIIVNIEATDSAENVTHSQLVLSVMTENSSMTQLINRITYGVTPELLKELRDYGTDSFIQQQLHPELIDDSAFDQQLSKLLLEETSVFHILHNSHVARAIASKRQLLEVMTQFWESHFNTDLEKTRSSNYEQMEHTLFRQHALGNFRDLLQVSATSPAMLKYLDNMFNYKDEPNENYARELLELHTLGVDNAYTAKDIAEVARVFTGWRIDSGNFFFSQFRHDDAEKIVLGTTIPSGAGITGGEIVLDLLAEHEATAQFICTKLLNKFISDSPTPATINHCATDFLAYRDQDNQIALVLEGIFKSTAFSDSLNFHNKARTPFEFIVAMNRQLPITVSHYNSRTSLTSMGMPLFYYPIPTGWPEKAKDLINSNQLLQRWQYTNKVLFNKPSRWRSHLLEPNTFLIEKGIETTEGVLGYLFELTLAHDYSELERDEALNILTNNQTEKFDIYAPEAELKIRNLIAMMLQYPSYQLQ